MLDEAEPADALWLEADGDWTLRLESWNTLPLVHGAQSGEGSMVLYFGDTAGSVDIVWQPATDDDQFSGRYYGESGESLLFGDTEPFDDVFELGLPGILAISTEGTWTVTPVS